VVRICPEPIGQVGDLLLGEILLQFEQNQFQASRGGRRCVGVFFDNPRKEFDAFGRRVGSRTQFGLTQQ
jgi:hypothetical protein